MDARPAEPRQRWRLVVAREAAARDVPHRDAATAWEAGLLASGLPVSMSEAATPRPRVSFAAPAPVGALAERELIDVVLSRLVRIDEVRAAVEAAAPPGYRLVDLYDVWLSSPTLASLVTAGEYRATVSVEGGGFTADLPAAIAAGIADILASPRIEHVRTKGHGEVTVDIRPHVLALRLAGAAGAAASPPPGAAPSGAGASFDLWMRLRLGGEGGIGRPDEIVTALGERLGRRLVVDQLTRERIVLADDPDVGP